eukprot:TRINITY_DN11573_c0_g1_i2.p1 TRINITY_DN11573_c0_g1~~TRINITY_DN11573_c0_g1_i2.p1  ORF type:complete len:180 (+),score=50.32 TRINITY_DN11573_c0_g1_i2:309-848(+)
MTLEEGMQLIIYLLDMGRAIPWADAIVACMDEPMDTGCVVEMTHGMMLGKAVVGWRTDTRTPFGAGSGLTRGGHFFAPFISDVFVTSASVVCASAADFEAENDDLANKLDKAIKAAVASKQGVVCRPSSAQNLILEAAAKLLSGVPEEAMMSDPNVLNKVIENYIAMESELRNVLPERG